MFDRIDLTALVAALIVFIAAVTVAWGIKRFQVTDSVGFLVVIVLPLATYGVVSGYVAKLSLPGGWAAEFRQVAAASIKPTPISPDAVQDLQVFEKAGLDAIQSYRDQIVPGKPIAIALLVRRTGYYNTATIAEYIRAFLAFDPNLTVIFLESDSRHFVASTNANAVLAAVSVQDPNNRFLNALETADLLAMQKLLVLTTATVSQDTTNAEALQKMITDGVDAIVKVDSDKKAVGLVRRDEIISRLMLKLASGN